MSKIQLRGHCQCCGNDQAVVQGRMSHHGYTVRDGWFQGICRGLNYAPVEHDRSELDRTVDLISKSVVELRKQADRIEGGDLPEKLLYRPSYKREAELTPVGSIPSYDRDAVVRGEVFRLRRRAEIGQAHCDYLTKIADLYHGKELIEVRPEDKPEPVRRGDKRILPTKGMGNPNAKITATCTSLGDRGKVYYTTGVVSPVTGKLRVSYTTTRSWRMWAKA